jgi:hypothetical protein
MPLFHRVKIPNRPANGNWYIGKEGIVERGYTEDGQKSQPYKLNADGTAIPLTEGKPSTTQPSNEKEPSTEGQNAGSATDALNTTNNIATAVGTETALVDAALSKGIGAAEDLGKAAKTAGAITKGIGGAATAIGIITAGVQLINEPTAGNATRLAVQGIGVAASFIPVAGWAVSLGIGIADIIWGDDFYNWIDKK